MLLFARCGSMSSKCINPPKDCFRMSCFTKQIFLFCNLQKSRVELVRQHNIFNQWTTMYIQFSNSYN